MKFALLCTVLLTLCLHGVLPLSLKIKFGFKLEKSLPNLSTAEDDMAAGEIDNGFSFNPCNQLNLKLDRNLQESFTLGEDVAGAVPIYSYSRTLNYDSVQSEISIAVNYPENADDDTAKLYKITKINVNVEGDDGYESQAYIADGGIDESYVELQLVAKKTAIFKYFVEIYGVKK